MHFKKRILLKVYHLYLIGIDIISISCYMDMNTKDINYDTTVFTAFKN